MMRSLYDLQGLDSEIDRNRAETASVEAGMKDDAELAQAREQLAGHEEQVRQLKVQQGSQDVEVKALQAKVQVPEQKLYGGSVRNPKELESIQAEWDFAKQELRKGEDELLAIMLALDEAEKLETNGRSAVASLEAELAQRRETLSREHGVLAQKLDELTERRQQMSLGIAPAMLGRYDLLRQTHRGQAVAKVERGMCTGCRLTLPTKEVQRVRTAKEAVTCSSCGRILYVS